MKKPVLSVYFILCLLGFVFNSPMLAHEGVSSAIELSSLKETTPPPVCNTPTWPSTNNITQTSATFNWSSVSGALSYSVEIRLPNGYWSSIPGSPFMNNYATVYNLQPGTTYEWRVRANCNYGESSYWTSPISFTTDGGGSCNPPSWLDTENITQTTATFDWSSVSGAVSYSVQWRYAGGNWNNLNGGPFYNTYVNVGGLNPGTAYEWRVRSNCSYGMTSAWSYGDSFTTLGYSCSTPTWPSTTNITQTTASFQWSPVSGADSYTVQIRLPNGTWYDIDGSPFMNNYATAYDLNPGTTYEWRVRANCGYGNYSNWTYPVSFTTDGGSCHAPSYLTTTNITHNSATWDWSSVSGAISYSIQWRYPGGTWYNLNGGPFTNSWVAVGGLDPSTTYEWRVKSNCYGGSSEWSYHTSFTTLGYQCETPTWPSTTNITETSATFHWSPVSGADSYTVQIRLPNGYWQDIAGNPFNGTYATVYNLSPNTTYEWRVRANCGYNDYSNWTYPISFTTDGASCHAPTWLGTTNITQTSATLDWSSVSGAMSYTVQYRLAGGTWYTLNGGPFTNSWADIWGLQPGTTYEWRVRSNCANWVISDWSYTVSFTTLGYSCETPTWPSTSNITETSATFHWSAVSGALSYTVQVRWPNGTWIDISGNPFSGTSATVYDLSPNTTYEWRVHANCGIGQYSNWTYPISFTTQGFSCHAPNWLATINITETSATLDWSPVSGALSYMVEYRLAGGTWYTLNGGPFTNTLAEIWGLEPGTAYEWRVRTNCINGMISDWSYPQYFTTLFISCHVPTGLHTTNITETSATFNWTPVAGAENYSVEIRLPWGNWTYIQGSPFSGTSATVDNLSPGTTYEWRVRANCGNGNYSYWSSHVVFTTSGSFSCTAPSELQTLNITQTTATWDWSPVSGAVSYSVQWRFAGGTWYNLPGGPWTNTILNIGGLQPGTAYEWRVRSNCANWTHSDWSAPAVFTTLGSSCTVPTELHTSGITETSATFNWTAVPGALNYSVQIRYPNGSWNYIPGSPFSGTSATHYSLIPGTTYEWRVRANCGYGHYSYWSGSVTFTTLGSSSCTAPVELVTMNITQTTATWDWAPVSGAVSYSVQWRFAGGTWYNLPGGPWTGTLLHIGGLQPGTDYEWRVRSNCHNWVTSDWSAPAAFTTLSSSCGVPLGLATTEITDTSAVFNWTAVAGAIDYSVQIRVPNSSWSFIPGSPFTGTSAMIDDLNPGTAYEWRVRANCGGGYHSSWSAPLGFTTTGTSPGNDNDHCSNAMVLPVNNTCVNTFTSNITATPSSPPPMGWCPTNWYKDVWFKFAMPDVSNPAVTIRTTPGGLTDGVMEVYTGNNCSDLIFLTCEDDNNNGNGSNMPVINLTGGAGDTVWVRVWGYAGTTGSFNICVFDYLSNSIATYDDDIVPLSDLGIEAIAEDKEIPKTENIAEPLYQVTPNPASDMLNIVYSQTSASMVTGLILNDMSGKILIKKDYQSTETNEFREELDVMQLTPGMYILHIMTTSGVISEKVSVVRN